MTSFRLSKDVIWLIFLFRKNEAQQRIETVKSSLGEPQRKWKRKYENINKNLRNTSATWSSRPTYDYLETIAMNLH